MGKPDNVGQDKPDKDSPLDHDQGQGNDPDLPEADQDLPDEEDGEPEVTPEQPA